MHCSGEPNHGFHSEFTICPTKWEERAGQFQLAVVFVERRKKSRFFAALRMTAKTHGEGKRS